jgi:hypothetical protein
MVGRLDEHGAGLGQHVAHPAHVAERGGLFEPGGDVGGVDLERAVKPGESGGHAVLAAGQLTP